MNRPTLAMVDPVDGTLYVLYEDSSVWAYRPPSKQQLLEGWRKVAGGPAVRQEPSVPSSTPARSASFSL